MACSANGLRKSPGSLPEKKGGCPTCRSLVSRRADGSGKRFGGIPGSVRRTLDSPGRALPGGLAGEMGSRLGFDFSGVRIHDDPAAGRSASDIGAEAYAAGRHVVFGSGRYSPDTSSGKRLLAHELAHVVQQGAADPAGHLELGEPGSFLESQADRLAEAAVMPGAAMPGSVPSGRAGGAAGDSVSPSRGAVMRSCSDGACDTCAGGLRDLWVTVFFRRRATRRTMARLRDEINAAKTLLRNCCINIKFDFDWRLLAGPSSMPAPTERPAGDVNGALDYNDDITNLGEGNTFSAARGIPMVVADEVPGSGGGMTVTSGADRAYTGRTYMVWALNETRRSDNTIAHELWHVAGQLNHDLTAGTLVSESGTGVSARYCTAVRTLV